jgi:Uma2 family endonuclease
MFDAQTKPMTLDEFIVYALLPENAERNLEFINGEMIEKMPGSTENSGIAANLVFETRLHCQVNNLPCFVSTGDGAYRIGQNVIAPDFAYKPTPLTKEYPDPEPPLWVAEVISLNDKVTEITKKRRKYIEAGILYWEFYPDERMIDVYAPGKPMATYGLNAEIVVDVISNLTIPVSKLFR